MIFVSLLCSSITLSKSVNDCSALLSSEDIDLPVPLSSEVVDSSASLSLEDIDLPVPLSSEDIDLPVPLSSEVVDSSASYFVEERVQTVGANISFEYLHVLGCCRWRGFFQRLPTMWLIILPFSTPNVSV